MTRAPKRKVAGEPAAKKTLLENLLGILTFANVLSCLALIISIPAAIGSWSQITGAKEQADQAAAAAKRAERAASAAEQDATSTQQLVLAARDSARSAHLASSEALLQTGAQRKIADTLTEQSSISRQNSRPNLVIPTFWRKFIKPGLPSKWAANVDNMGSRATPVAIYFNYKILVREKGTDVPRFSCAQAFADNDPYTVGSTIGVMFPQDGPMSKADFDAVDKDEKVHTIVGIGCYRVGKAVHSISFCWEAGSSADTQGCSINGRLVGNSAN